MNMSELQWARLVAHVAVHNMQLLLEYFRDGDKALNFTQQALITRPELVQHPTACPMDTQLLIEDLNLREQLGKVQDLSPMEQRNIIKSFMNCFYPGMGREADQHIGLLQDGDLECIISTPGALHKTLEHSWQSDVFDPPWWISFSQQSQGPSEESKTDGKDDDSHELYDGHRALLNT